MILKLITHIARIFVGAMFVFSGFVKLVDPIGSQYKFEEYFGADVLNIEFLIPYALPLAILLILVELLLGISLWLGHKKQLTLWSLFGLTLLFLFLTWYSATYDKVTDCGCFGDAIKLTPWETFYKNVVFIVMLLFLLFAQKHIQPVFGKHFRNWTMLTSLVASVYVIYLSLNYLPIIDFRPYAVEKNLIEGMEYNDDGDIPPVHDFYLYSETEELTETILEAEKVMLIVANELEKTPQDAWEIIKSHGLSAVARGYQVYILSSSSSALVNTTITENKLPFEILFCDATALKTMCRANPGILELSYATVMKKYSWKEIEI